MHYLALATDYDGTLAREGAVDAPTLDALTRLRGSGRSLVLVTGRELGELTEVFPRLDLFDRVVAENGAVLYRPADRSETVLASPPPDSFVEELKRRGVGPISVGRVIVATWEPHATVVADVIRETRLDLRVTHNKRAVMVLPSGVNKATGLSAALRELGISPRKVVAVGDAENDLAFLAAAGCAAAVANALPALKRRANVVTRADHGAGVAELIDALIADDLRSVSRRRLRRDVLGLVVALAVCYAVAGLGGLATSRGLVSWYPALRKPGFTPPNWVFGPVWTALYTMMAVSAWLVWRKGGRGPLGWFAAQLALNLGWSCLFFGLRSPGLAAAEIVALWAAILGTIVAFWRVSAPAGALLVPYLLWVTYAAALNFAIWGLNQG